MRVIGVDPGLKATGYGVIEFDPARVEKMRILEAGTIEPKVKDLMPQRIAKVYKNLDAVIAQFTPEVMVLEKLYAHYKHPTTACILGHVRGAICLLAAHRGLNLVEASVKRVRQTLVGNGNASKEQTRGAVSRIFKIDESKLTLDASDALALAAGQAYSSRYPTLGGKVV